jgi:hypothetical protein
MLRQMAKSSPVEEAGALEIGLYAAWSVAVMCFVDYVMERSLKTRGNLGACVVSIALGLGAAHFVVTILFWCMCATHFEVWATI